MKIQTLGKSQVPVGWYFFIQQSYRTYIFQYIYPILNSFIRSTHLGIFIGDLVPSPAAAGNFLDHQLSVRRRDEQKYDKQVPSTKLLCICQTLLFSPPLPLVEQKSQQTDRQTHQQQAEHHPHHLAPPGQSWSVAVIVVRFCINSSAN